jgi:hypothetical protein
LLRNTSTSPESKTNKIKTVKLEIWKNILD